MHDVGEKFGMSSNKRRLNITDATWAGLAKGMEIYQKSVLFNLNLGIFTIGKYKYYPDLDKWHVVSNGDMRNETPQCDIVDKMARVNVSYRQSNVRHVGKGGQNTIGSFPRFKGVFGYQGTERNYFESGSCPSWVMEWGETEFEDKFRLE